MQPLRFSLFAVSAVISLATVAQVPTNSSVNPNSRSLTMERYCDPAKNADTFAALKALEDQMNALDKSKAAQLLELRHKYVDLSNKLDCTYRSIQK